MLCALSTWSPFATWTAGEELKTKSGGSHALTPGLDSPCYALQATLFSWQGVMLLGYPHRACGSLSGDELSCRVRHSLLSSVGSGEQLQQNLVGGESARLRRAEAKPSLMV